MNKGIEHICLSGKETRDQVRTLGNGQVPKRENSVANPTFVMSHLSYTLPDHERTLRGKLMQMIIDYVHKGSD